MIVQRAKGISQCGMVRPAGWLVACVALCLAPVSAAHAGIFTLEDHNSTVEIDTAGGSGVFNWTVDGVDQLAQQWFWFRTSAADLFQPVNVLPVDLEGTNDLNFDGDDDALFVRYAGRGFDVEFRYVLAGGAVGSKASDLAEQIKITNMSNLPLHFELVQYNDYDLNGATENDSAVFTNNNTVRQYDGNTQFTETVVTPQPTYRELAEYPVTINNLFSSTANLSNTPVEGVVLGPGDVTWAFQWNFDIAAGGSRTISKDKNILGAVPEPSSWTLMAIAGGLLAYVSRRRVKGS
jgi:hypothetical protein